MNGNGCDATRFRGAPLNPTRTTYLHLLLTALGCLTFAVWPAPRALGVADELTRGLLAHLPLTDDLLDHSPQRLAVKVNGRVALRDGGAWFGGQKDWLELPHLALNRRPFAFAVWLRVTGANPMYGIFEQMDQCELDQWLHLMLRGGRQPYVGFLMNDAISPLPLPQDAWVHVVFQYSGTRQEIWIDGRLICARNSGPYRGTSGPTFIGKSPRWSNVPSQDFEGFIRDVRILGRALTATEIGRVLRASVPPGRTAPAHALASAAGAGDHSFEALAADVGIPFLSIQGQRLVITGEASQTYDLFYTDDLNTPWQPLVTLHNPNGRIAYTDTSADRSPSRFYRIKVR